MRIVSICESSPSLLANDKELFDRDHWPEGWTIYRDGSRFCACHPSGKFVTGWYWNCTLEMSGPDLPHFAQHRKEIEKLITMETLGEVRYKGKRVFSVIQNAPNLYVVRPINDGVIGCPPYIQYIRTDVDGPPKTTGRGLTMMVDTI